MVAETAHHMSQDEGNLERLDEVVIRERAVYAVDCRVVLLDLSAKGKSHPSLRRPGRNRLFDCFTGLLARQAQIIGALQI